MKPFIYFNSLISPADSSLITEGSDEQKEEAQTLLTKLG